jgi:hypothetical protein
MQNSTNTTVNQGHKCIYLADYFKLRKKKEKTESNVCFNHMVGIKTTGEQLSILCHNETIFDKPVVPLFTVVFVLFGIYTPDNLFPRPIVNQGGGLSWILSDSNVSFDGQSSFFLGFVKYGFIVTKD